MSDPSPAPSSEPAEQASEVQLDSWKEIASYVKRDVSTVQRWEKREGMPVHRHVHDKRGSVYALSSELDAWLQTRKLRLEEEEKDHRPETSPETSEDAEADHGSSGTPWMRRWLGVSGFAVLALLGAAYVMTRSRTVDATQHTIKSLAVLPLKNL